jgi:hypothetical protein
LFNLGTLHQGRWGHPDDFPFGLHTANGGNPLK